MRFLDFKVESIMWKKMPLLLVIVSGGLKCGTFGILNLILTTRLTIDFK